jgi:hypothetical protein
LDTIHFSRFGASVQFFLICRLAVIHKVDAKEINQKIPFLEKGQFSIWAVSTISQGFEILTGLPTGSPMVHPQTGELSFEPGTAYERVNRRLVALGEKMTPANGEKVKK